MTGHGSRGISRELFVPNEANDVKSFIFIVPMCVWCVLIQADCVLTPAGRPPFAVPTLG
jgi:hypothetical protein